MMLVMKKKMTRLHRTILLNPFIQLSFPTWAYFSNTRDPDIHINKKKRKE
jgi:hypothetical protein